MSKNAQAILDEIRSLPLQELQMVWQELGRQLGQIAPTAPAERYGEPLTDEDIEQSARTTFQILHRDDHSELLLQPAPRAGNANFPLRL